MFWFSPLIISLYLWMVLLAYWKIAARFTNQTRQSESFGGRVAHILPLLLAYYLIFYPRWPVFYGSLYTRHWTDWTACLGLLLTVAGLIFAAWARAHLGRYWSGIITLKEGHRLITTGPYRCTRHPIYTGWTLAILGSAITAGTGDAFVGVVFVALSFVFKLRREEKLMASEFGPEYAQFKKDVPAALVPLIY